MVETITPVVHGGSRERWGISLALHAFGATVAAAIVGSLLAGAGALLGAPWGVPGAWLVVAATALYVARELGAPVPVPQLRRQVPDWWRTFFPPHVAAFLYGLGLGPGFLTYLGHGTVVVVAVAAFASGRPLLGAAVLAPFGLARGLGPVLAFGVRSPGDAAALVERLDRSASKARWRVANALALSMVLVAAVREIRTIDAPSEAGALAAAVLALTFGAAAVAKLARRAAWRRTLGSYGLRSGASRLVGLGVPAVELGIAATVLVGLASSAGLLSIVALVAFSGAIVVGRVRAGRRLECGCFGGSGTRDYRLLLARNLALAGVAFVAWRAGEDAPLVRALGETAGADLLPVALVVLGLALAVWVGAVAFAGGGRRNGG
ncbi:MAG TPA: MauE/DoxX family redox-associated membrane protein [Actinomycetota bacterium]